MMRQDWTLGIQASVRYMYATIDRRGTRFEEKKKRKGKKGHGIDQ